MIEFTAEHFAGLCREGPVKAQIDTIEASRRAAVRKFWLRLLGGLAASFALAYLVSGWLDMPAGVTAFILLGIVAIIAAMSPLTGAAQAIKHPVLETLAAQGGMSFTAEGFEPPVFAEAHNPLFGSWISSATFTDLFFGQDTEGRHLAIYEATLIRGHGRYRHEAFSGQVYAFQRARGGGAEIVAVPDKGMFNFFKPAGSFSRVRIEADPAFEKKFEVYAVDPAEASALFADPQLRALFLELRERGRVFAYVGPSDILVAVQGKNRFEPGSMLRSRGGEERVKLMFDDVCASMGVINRLRAALA